jgi:hypothetical protein
MFKNLVLAILFILPCTLLSQEVFQYGDSYGVKYNGAVVHNARYSKIERTDYFVAGKDELYWYNLSQKGLYPEKRYKKFLYHLKNELIIVGLTTEGKIDLFNETGEFIYMLDGDYDKVSSTFDLSYGMYDSELLCLSRKGKKGLYNWLHKKEVLPPLYDKIKIHTNCKNGGEMMLFLQDEGVNRVMNPFGEVVFEFSNRSIDDISNQSACDGFMLKRGHKLGYMRRLRSGKYFLIKPIYDRLLFPEDNGDLILCQRGLKYGLYYKNKRILTCKYDKIDITDNGYIFGVAIRNLKKVTFDKEGTIMKMETISYDDEY